MLAPALEHESATVLHDGAMSYVVVRDLQPGDVFVMDGTGGMATVVVTTSHPLYTSPVGAPNKMALVIWYLHEERRFSLDALMWRQELPGRVMPTLPDVKRRALEEALRGGQL
jgi:hypothetical protein